MNWPALMALGLGVLRLPPQTFWQMTPREFSAALHGAIGHISAPPMNMAEFSNLAARFPDEDRLDTR